MNTSNLCLVVTFHYTNKPMFVHSFINGYLDGWLLGIKMLMIFLHAYVFLLTDACISFEWYLKVHELSWIRLPIWETARLIPKIVLSFYNAISSIWRFYFLLNLNILSIPILFYFSHLSEHVIIIHWYEFIFHKWPNPGVYPNKFTMRQNSFARTQRVLIWQKSKTKSRGFHRN